MTSKKDDFGSRFKNVKEMMSKLQLEEAIKNLKDLLADTAYKSYEGLLVGELGQAYFLGGNASLAIQETIRAINICRADKDVEGINAYFENLIEMYRYDDKTKEAADTCESFVGFLKAIGDVQKATKHIAWAKRIRNGEPLNRIVVRIGGLELELDELKDINLKDFSGNLQLIYKRNKISLPSCTTWMNIGKQKGSAGDFEGAIKAFRIAANFDKFSPDPKYEEGYTLMQLCRFDEALESYKECERLAPSWYNVRSDLYLAQQLSKGAISKDDFPIYNALKEGMISDLSVIDKLLKLYPHFGGLYLLKGTKLSDANHKQEAITILREGLKHVTEDAETHSKILTQLAVCLPEGKEKESLIDEAIKLNGSIFNSAAVLIQKILGK